MARSKGKRPAPAAAAAETQTGAEVVTASAEVKPTTKSQRTPRRSGGRPAPKTMAASSSSGGLVTAVGNKMWEFEVTFPAQPRPLTESLYDGEVITTDVYRDRVQYARPQIMQFISNIINFSVVTGIQNNSTAHKEVEMTQTLAPFIANLYGSIARNYQAKYNRTIRDTVLTTPGVPGTSEGSLALWIVDHADAYLRLRGLEGWHSAGNFNESTAKVSAQISNFLPRLKNDLRRLMEYKVPKQWLDILDMMCGPYALDEDSTAWGCQMGLDPGGNFDMSAAVTIDQILDQAETHLSSLAFPNAAANNDDYQRIANTFSLAYASEALPGPKKMVYDGVGVALPWSSLQISHDTAGAVTNSWPNLNATGLGSLMVPILVPRTKKSAACAMMFTAMRPAVVSNDPVTGLADTALASQIGFLNNWQTISTQGNFFIRYDNINGVHATQQSQAGAGTIIAGTDNVIFPWEVFAQMELPTYTTESMPWLESIVYYQKYTSMLDQTVRLLEQCWLGPVSK